MMQIISREEFRELLNYSGDHCVSIFLPTHRSGVAVNEKQDAILFKNALQAVSANLQDKGVAGEIIEALLKPAFELYKNEVFGTTNQMDWLCSYQKTFLRFFNCLLP